jgi:hypothetical protein
MIKSYFFSIFSAACVEIAALHQVMKKQSEAQLVLERRLHRTGFSRCTTELAYFHQESREKQLNTEPERPKRIYRISQQY